MLRFTIINPSRQRRVTQLPTMQAKSRMSHSPYTTTTSGSLLHLSYRSPSCCPITRLGQRSISRLIEKTRNESRWRLLHGPKKHKIAKPSQDLKFSPLSFTQRLCLDTVSWPFWLRLLYPTAIKEEGSHLSRHLSHHMHQQYQIRKQLLRRSSV